MQKCQEMSASRTGTEKDEQLGLMIDPLLLHGGALPLKLFLLVVGVPVWVDRHGCCRRQQLDAMTPLAR
jgi:hypothetical protein